MFCLLKETEKGKKVVYLKKKTKNFEEKVYVIDGGCGNLISKSQIN